MPIKVVRVAWPVQMYVCVVLCASIRMKEACVKSWHYRPARL